MNKKGLFAILAIVPLFVLSCSKEVSQEPQEWENIVSVIDPWTGRDISEYNKTAPLSAPVTIAAGYEATKSHLELDGDSYANVVWDAEDKFKMMGLHENAGGGDYASGWYEATFTASTGGSKVNFTADYLVPSSPNFHCFYVPLSTKGIYHTGDESFGFGITIPTIQTPTANGIQKGLSYSYAKSASYGADVHFQNMLSLVRFKLSGAVVSTLTSITLQGVYPLAGDCVLVPATDGTPELSLSKAFVGDASSNTVRLSGSFAADTWYYFAVAPGIQPLLSLSFTDGDKLTTKISSKPATFTRGRITSLGTFDLGDALEGDDPNKTIKYKTATKAGLPRPVTFAVVPDGFRQAEMGTYELLAKAAVDAIFNVEPFKTYAEYFNVYILKVPSNASGARISDGTLAEQNRDCYFQSSWPAASYKGMQANGDKIFQFVRDNCPDILDGIHPITEVPVLMIINDTRYGGINWTYSDGKAYCMAPYCENGAALSWEYPDVEAASDEYTTGTVTTPPARFTEFGKANPTNVGNWLNIVVHEFGGHCFSRLTDEYWYNDTEKDALSYLDLHRWDVPYGTNISVSYDNPGYDAVANLDGWQHLLDNQSTLMAKDARYGRIGVFQGGDVSIHNRWRSERISCMIDNRYYFSTFQRELIVKRILSLAGEAFDFNTFIAKDVTLDPNRDIVSSPVRGAHDPVTPRTMPPLPPPVLVVVD